MRITSPRVALAAAILWSLVVICALAALGKTQDPVSRGTAADFWHAACGVDVGGASNSAYLSAFIADGRAWYSIMGYHGSLAYSLPEDEAMKAQPAVIASLERLTLLPGDDWRKTAYVRWKKLSAPDTANLLLAMEDAREQTRLKRLADDMSYPGTVEWHAQALHGLRTAAQKRENYWMNFVFEGCFLIGLARFALWPAIRLQSAKRHLLHILVTPSLLMLPAWMGYCSFWHPNVQPAGGVVYPWIISVLRNDLPNYGFELPYRYLPQIFFPLSQWDTWTIDDVIAIRAFVHVPPGPFQSFVAGLLPCGIYLLVRHWLRRLRSPGFEVLPPTPSNTTPESAPPDSAHL